MKAEGKNKLVSLFQSSIKEIFIQVLFLLLEPKLKPEPKFSKDTKNIKLIYLSTLNQYQQGTVDL